jgi:hypothetical protein
VSDSGATLSEVAVTDEPGSSEPALVKQPEVDNAGIEKRTTELIKVQAGNEGQATRSLRSGEGGRNAVREHRAELTKRDRQKRETTNRGRGQIAQPTLAG